MEPPPSTAARLKVTSPKVSDSGSQYSRYIYLGLWGQISSFLCQKVRGETFDLALGVTEDWLGMGGG